MRTRMTCLALVVAAGAAPAFGQNALDRPLQQDLRTNGSAGYTRPDFAQEVRLRNALVTGNVGGGKSLQITAPYSGLGDFHGTLGTDSLFAFRRDSFGYSNTNTFRNSDALSFQTIYALGNNQPRASAFVNRFGDAGAPPASAGSVLSGQANPLFSNRSPSSPSDALPPGSLRSTSEYVSTRGLNPSLIGYQQTDQGLERLTASTLLGVRSNLAKTADEQFSEGAGLNPSNSAASNAIDTSAQAKPDSAYRTAYDRLRDQLNSTPIDTSVNAPPKGAGEAGTKATTPNQGTPTRSGENAPDKGGAPKAGDASGPGAGSAPLTTPQTSPATTPANPNPLNSPNSPNQAPGTSPVSPPGGAPVGFGNTTPEAAAADAAEQAALAKLPPWERRVQELRKVLESPPLAVSKAAPGQEIEPTPQERALGLDTPEKLLAARSGLDPETISILQSATPSFSEYLSGEPKPGDLYGQLLYEGQKYLREGKYFDSEERFAAAAAMRPGDVTSLVGRINAELGAGLYLSAAVNLRSLYSSHPEVIGVRFTGDAVPRIDRMKLIMVDLRQQIQNSKAASQPARPEVTLLLAYVGYQLENTDALRDGLAESRALQTAGGGQVEPLQNVLEAVWLRRDLRAIPAAPTPPGK